MNLRQHVQREAGDKVITRREKEKEESSRKGEVDREGIERAGDGAGHVGTAW